MDSIVIGIDVSKERLDIAELPAGEHFAISRDQAGLGEWVQRLMLLAPAAIGVEATGGYETIGAASLAAARLPVVVINPAQVRHFAQALGQRAKSDPIGAFVIARFVAATKPALRRGRRCARWR